LDMDRSRPTPDDRMWREVPSEASFFAIGAAFGLLGIAASADLLLASHVAAAVLEVAMIGAGIVSLAHAAGEFRHPRAIISALVAAGLPRHQRVFDLESRSGTERPDAPGRSLDGCLWGVPPRGHAVRAAARMGLAHVLRTGWRHCRHRGGNGLATQRGLAPGFGARSRFCSAWDRRCRRWACCKSSASQAARRRAQRALLDRMRLRCRFSFTGGAPFVRR